MYFSARASSAVLRKTIIWRIALCWAVLMFALAYVDAEALTLTGVKLSKTHGTVGTFELPVDVSQPVDGAVTVEPRAIGGGHQLVFKFDTPITNAGAVSVIDINGVAIGTSSLSFSGNNVLLVLTGVPDKQRVAVTLSNVNGSASFAPVSIGFLVGDVNSNQSVSLIDIAAVKARAGQTANALNFKFDLNASGAINASDVSAAKSRSGSALPVALKITALSTLSTAPATLLTISGSGFDASAVMLVQYSNASGYSIRVPPVALTPTTMTVSVPPLTDPASGNFVAGSVGVQVVKITTDRTSISNTIGGFQISSPPTSASIAGTVTLQFYSAMRGFAANSLQTSITGTSLDTVQLRTALTNQIAQLDILIPQIQTLVSDGTKSFLLGSIANRSIVVTTADLAKVDRVILSMLAAQAVTASIPAAAAAARTVSTQASRAKAESVASINMAAATGCQGPEASAAVSQFSSNGNPDPNALIVYYGSSKSSANCNSAAAINTGLSVVEGAGGVALGVLALVGAPVEALALPAAALLYVAIATSGGEIGIGGALGQASSGAVSLVQDGMKSLDELGTALLVKAIAGGVLLKMSINPEPLAALASTLYGAHSLHSAFTQAPPLNGGGNSGTNYTLTISNSGTGSGEVLSYPGSLICGGALTVCSGSFPSGTTVFLNPSSGTTSGFSSWSGACTGNGVCQVAVVSGTSTSAVFNSLPTCTYTYTQYSTCQPNSTQTRAVLSSSPAGCVGSPVLSQPCTYDCLAKYNYCLTQPACNPPSDLITQNQCVNACISAWLSCL